MKSLRTTLCVALALLLPWLTAWAGPVDSLAALQLARTQLNQGPQTRGGANPELVYKHQGLSGTTDAYIFNAPGAGQGFAIVAGDDALPAILGYSHTGTIDPDKMPIQLREYLRNASRAVKNAKEGKGYYSSVRSGSLYTKVYQPLLKDLIWGQDEPFDGLTPGEGEDKTPVGCVATAVAQIMRFHCWPKDAAKGKGKYSLGDSKKPTSVSIEGHTYKWDQMPSYYGESSTKAQKDAVARLMYDVGLASAMNYKKGGSGAFVSDAANGLVKNFGYSDGMYYLQREYFTWSAWEKLMQQELEEGRPILYAGYSPEGGHAYVVDGYDGNGKYHFNWGWDGYGNGYFSLIDCDPAVGGTGAGGGGGYVGGTEMLVGLQPNALGYSKTVKELGRQLYMLAQADKVSLTADGRVNGVYLENARMQVETISATYAVYDETGENRLNVGTPLPMDIVGASWGAVWTTISTNGLKDGEYRVQVVVRPRSSKSDDDWSPVPTTVAGPHYLKLTLKDGKATIAPGYNAQTVKLKAEVVKNTFFSNKSAVVRVKFTNEGEQDYNGWLGIGESDSKESAPNMDDKSARVPVLLPPGQSYEYEYYFKEPITKKFLVFVYGKNNGSISTDKGVVKNLSALDGIEVKTDEQTKPPTPATKETLFAQFVEGTPATIGYAQPITIKVKVSVKDKGLYDDLILIGFFDGKRETSTGIAYAQAQVIGEAEVAIQFSGALPVGKYTAQIYGRFLKESTTGVGDKKEKEKESVKLPKGEGDKTNDQITITIEDVPATIEGVLPQRTYQGGVIYESGVALNTPWLDPPTPVAAQVLLGARVAPNPVVDALRVLNCEGAVRYEVYSVSGARVAGGLHDGAPTLEVSASHWTPGLYLLRLVTPEGVRTLPLVKQ